jgi:bifunctional non-homologous end joining protein LigD
VKNTIVEIEDRRVKLSNLEKDLYPSYGFTKADVLDYYRAIAPIILPHLHDRALTFKRYPDGVESGFFFEKRCPGHRPAWVQTAEIVQHHGDPITFCLVNDLETLMWVENLASLELHVPLARAGSPTTPDVIVFDLDPGDGVDALACGRVALILRDLLAGMGLSSYIKTSGNKGLHVVVPLNRPGTTFDGTKAFSKAAATIMQKHYPGLVTAKMAKQERSGKVFINWSQNDSSLTTISVYSLRAREKPYVSFPLEWKEVDEAVRVADADRLQVLHSEALRRTKEQGDLFLDVLVKEQKLPKG